MCPPLFKEKGNHMGCPYAGRTWACGTRAFVGRRAGTWAAPTGENRGEQGLLFMGEHALLMFDSLIRQLDEVGLESKRERRYFHQITALTLGLQTSAPQLSD